MRLSVTPGWTLNPIMAQRGWVSSPNPHVTLGLPLGANFLFPFPVFVFWVDLEHSGVVRRVPDRSAHYCVRATRH